ncbi:MAG: HDOD domain-containing protein [Candidatus Thiodiazotropha endolucinida]|nr:HDOD domain-containing protein [Candidatus Thiodiazotropha taylori]MCW4241860.1 HDOD domain-containing protein [Candidatus Thiodiazotropha taylori]
MSTLWEKITRDCKLISLPDVYIRLKTIIDTPEYRLDDVADTIRSDPALTTRVLKLINSPYFGLASKIETVFRAVSLLGTQQIHDLTLATCISESLHEPADSAFDMQDYWRRSIFCGLVAQGIARRMGLIDSERLFVCGLLFDLGHLIMHQSIPEETKQALQHSQQRCQPLVEVERELIGLDYARVGATLMRQWSFPLCLVETTEFHNEPLRARHHPAETAMVHIAAIVSETLMGNGKLGEGLNTPHQAALERTGLDLAACRSIAEEVKPGIEHILHTIYPLKNAS